MDRNKDRVYFLAGFFFSEGYFPAGFFFFLGAAIFFRKSEVIVLVVVLRKTLKNIIYRGGVRIRKFARGAPLWLS